MGVRLVVLKGKTSRSEVRIESPVTVIGRQRGCDLRIPSSLVSRMHCELTLEGDRLRVRDLGSSNGTFVNGTKIKEQEVTTGDTLAVGPVTFVVRIDGVPPREEAGEKVEFFVAEEAGGEEGQFVVAEPAGTDEGGVDFVLAEIAEGEESGQAEASEQEGGEPSFLFPAADDQAGGEQEEEEVVFFSGDEGEAGAAGEPEEDSVGVLFAAEQERAEGDEGLAFVEAADDDETAAAEVLPAAGAARPAPGANNGMAIASLVLGIVGILVAPVGFMPVLGLVAAVPGGLAIFFGVLGRRRASEGAPQGGLATGGLVCGCVGLALALLFQLSLWLLFGAAIHAGKEAAQTIQKEAIPAIEQQLDDQMKQMQRQLEQQAKQKGGAQPQPAKKPPGKQSPSKKARQPRLRGLEAK